MRPGPLLLASGVPTAVPNLEQSFDQAAAIAKKGTFVLVLLVGATVGLIVAYRRLRPDRPS
jgi:hypothetical protein